VLVLCGCAERDRAWKRADELWQRRDPAAFTAWKSLNPSTNEGARAHAALARADDEYRRGIALLSGGDDAQARTLLAEASRRAPIDPALYLPLARACRARGLDGRAAAMYRKYLAQKGVSGAGDVAAARRELGELGDDIGAPFEPPPEAPMPAVWVWGPSLLAAAALVALALVIAPWRRRRRASLEALAADHPELQPAIAFLVGCLRHELLKHRIIAVGDAVRAVAEGKLDDKERRFLLTRLYGGEPLAVAWAGHLGAFMRALGPRIDLVRRDPAFAAAGRAIDAIAGAEAGLGRGDSDAAARVLEAHGRLRAFDAALGGFTTRLQHTVVDGALLDAMVGDVRRELGHAPVEIVMTAPAGGVAVECYHFDLTLVLRNVVRNAVAAAANGPEPGRVAIDVAVALEPTGDEIVRIRVRDTNPSPLPAPAQALEARGLTLVRAALARCDGSLSVEAGGDGFAKCVVVRLFRALSAAEVAA